MVLIWCQAWNQVWCAARRVVKGAAIGMGCATVLCCRGYEGGDSQTDLSSGLSAAASGQSLSGAPTGAEMGAFTAGMAITATMIAAGSALDNVVITALTDPEIAPQKKKTLRCLNGGYSLAKLGLVAGIVKGFSWYVDQCERKGDKAQGILGGLSAASLVLMSLAKTVWV